MKDVERFLGKSFSDPEVQGWLAGFREADQVGDSGQAHVHHTFKQAGVTLMVDRNSGKVFCFVFYGPQEPSSDYGTYSSELPLGLLATMSADEATAVLDPTGPRLFDDAREKGWETSLGCRVSIELGRDLRTIRSISFYL